MQKSLEILVAEHDRDVAEGLCDILDLAGHNVQHASTAEKTCELLRLHDFHVAFVNVKMEGRSKLESFAEVRKIKPDAKLIMMSAHTIDQLTAEATGGGMVKVLAAPVEMDSVVEALSAMGPAGTLLIEDVPANFGTTLQTAFKERNTNAAIAYDRDEALATLDQGDSDVLLLDLHLTVIRSLEIYLEVRRQGYSQPVIVFQSYAEDGRANNDILRSDVLFKPFDPGYMVKLLENMAITLHGGTVSQTPAIAAAPDVDDRADEPDAQGVGEAVDRAPGEVLLWEEAGPLEAPPLGTGGPLGEAEQMPPQASEPGTAKNLEPSPVPSPDVVPENPSPIAEAPAQTEKPDECRPESGQTGIWDEESPGEARLPAGVGVSVEQLEQAVIAVENAGSYLSDDAPAGAGEAPETSAEGIRVLVVDDDHDMAEGLAEVLDDTGLVVKVAHTSESALATLEDFDAKIALVDIQLGRNSGLELIVTLKELRPELIVIMVTAQTEQQTAIEALRKGAFDYLNKPLHPEELLAAMDRCFDVLAKRAAQPASPQELAAAAGPEVASAEYMAKLSQKLGTAHNPVLGFSEVLSEEMLGSTVPAHYAEETDNSGNPLETVIADFADIDSSGSGKVEIYEQEVDLTRAIFDCLKLVQPAASAGDLTVEIELAEIPVFMIGDRYKLSQIMLCLLINAIKFTAPRGKIQFILERDDDGAIVILVKDAGAGMTEEMVSQALASVIGSDGELAPGYQGSGLSLPLASSMAKLHGGRLTLDSEAGAGTTATLRLPPERNIAPKRSVAL